MDFIPYRLFSIVPPFSVVSKCALAGGLFKPPSVREVAAKRDGRSLRDFEFRITSTRRALPQSPTATAPSRREPYRKISSQITIGRGVIPLPIL